MSFLLLPLLVLACRAVAQRRLDPAARQFLSKLGNFHLIRAVRRIWHDHDDSRQLPLRRCAVRSKPAFYSGEPLPLRSLSQAFRNRCLYASARLERAIPPARRGGIDPRLRERRGGCEGFLCQMRLDFVWRRMAGWSASVHSHWVHSTMIPGSGRSFTLTSMHGRRGTRLRMIFRNTAGVGAHEERLTKGVIATFN